MKMKDTKAIIFDKDGTLLDFDAFWVPVSEKAILDVLAYFGEGESLLFEILEAFGVHNGVTDIDGVLCKGTYEEMGEIVYNVLYKNGHTVAPSEVIKRVISSYNEATAAGKVKPTSAELFGVLKKLKNQGKKLAVITTDNEIITRQCLKTLGIEELFDDIYTDDGRTPTKPDPYYALDFIKRYNLKSENVLMVGDTETDVLFAKNAGINMIALAKSESNRKKLLSITDIAVTDLSELLFIIK